MDKEYCDKYGHNSIEAVFWWVINKAEFIQGKSLTITVETKYNGSKTSGLLVEHILNNKQYIDSIEICLPNIDINLHFKTYELKTYGHTIDMKIDYNETYYTFTFCLEVI